MVGVGAQYVLMPLMTEGLGWSDTVILIVSFLKLYYFTRARKICSIS